jgi:hypothetical protein
MNSMNSNLLFTASTDYKPDRFVGLFLRREMRSQSLTHKGLLDLQSHLKIVLPDQLYSKIPWANWDFSANEAVNVYYRNELYFPLEAVNAIPTLDPPSFKQRYRDYLKTLPEIQAYPMPGPTQGIDEDGPPTNHFGESFENRFDRDIDLIANQFSIAFNPNQETQARYQAFVRLKDNDLFQETGAGFLIYLLPQNQLESLLGYNLELTAKDKQGVHFQYGRPTQSDLYQSMLYIQDLLNDRSVDLRLLRESSALPASTDGLK